MVMIKLALELCALAILTVVVKKIISSTFSFSRTEGSPARWRGESQWYAMLLLVMGLILSIISFWAIYGLFYILHSVGHYSGIMVVSQGALVVPAIIIGFSASLIFAKHVYLNIFGMNDSIFEEEEEGPGHRKGWFKSFFTAFTLGLAMLLLAFQFGVYLKTDGQNIYAKRFGEAEKVYSLKDIERVTSEEASSEMAIYLANGEKLSTAGYSGNLNYFLDHLSE